MELLLKPLSFHPVQSKTIIDKFAAVGILQVVLQVLLLHGIHKKVLGCTT